MAEHTLQAAASLTCPAAVAIFTNAHHVLLQGFIPCCHVLHCANLCTKQYSSNPRHLIDRMSFSKQNLFDEGKSIFEALEDVRQATAQASNRRQQPQLLVQVPHLYEKYHIAKVRPADTNETCCEAHCIWSKHTCYTGQLLRYKCLLCLLCRKTVVFLQAAQQLPTISSMQMKLRGFSQPHKKLRFYTDLTNLPLKGASSLRGN